MLLLLTGVYSSLMYIAPCIESALREREYLQTLLSSFISTTPLYFEVRQIQRGRVQRKYPRLGANISSLQPLQSFFRETLGALLRVAGGVFVEWRLQDMTLQIFHFCPFLDLADYC